MRRSFPKYSRTPCGNITVQHVYTLGLYLQNERTNYLFSSRGEATGKQLGDEYKKFGPRLAGYVPELKNRSRGSGDEKADFWETVLGATAFGDWNLLGFKTSYEESPLI